MIQSQPPTGQDTPRHYAWCQCGVCAPLRRTHEAAQADEQAHDTVCSDRSRQAVRTPA